MQDMSNNDTLIMVNKNSKTLHEICPPFLAIDYILVLEQELQEYVYTKYCNR